MTLSPEARARLADVVELQPTKNAELIERWELESGSEVHQYLEGELSAYYFRDDDGLIRATEEAAELVDVEPGVIERDGETAIRIAPFQQRVFEVVPDHDAESDSVVSILQTYRAAHDDDPAAEAVREALNALKRKGVVEVIRRAVPTYRLAAPRETVSVATTDASDESTANSDDAKQEGDGILEEIVDDVESTDM
jgi:hypothetical protein